MIRKTINSLSGGKTSSYLAVHHPADYNLFALVRTNDKICLFPDAKIRQEVSDRIGTEFIGTLEDDMIIYTMLDLEQYIGQEIKWVTGELFDDIIFKKKSGITFLPSHIRRFCTTEMKLIPITRWVMNNLDHVPIMRIGFRANEGRRARAMMARADENGHLKVKLVTGKSKFKTVDRWSEVDYAIPEFPLLNSGVYKDQIEAYWKDKPVRFAWMNNCVGCFHKEPTLLNKMWKNHPNKLEWFAKKERESINNATWKTDMTYDQIKNWNIQIDMFDDDFNECDSGYCGI